MKRGRRNGLLVLLLVLLLAVGLAGCGGGGTAPSGGDPPAEVEDENGAVNGGDAETAALLQRGRAVESFSYEFVSTLPTGETTSHRMWYDRGNMRVEIDDPVSGLISYNIVNADEGISYFYQPETGMAFAFPIDDREEEQDTPLMILEETDPSDLFLVGQETFDGRRCRVYEMTYAGDTVKIWVWEETGVPLRVETTLAGELYVSEYRDFQIGDIDPALFSLPPGTEVLGLDEMLAEY